MRPVRPRAPRALVCAPLPPEYDKESGSRRIYHIIEMLRAAGWSVAFVCENAPARSPHVRHLRQLGVSTYVGFDAHAESLVAAGEFDVAVFAFWYLADAYADIVRRLSPATRIVIETVDVHWLRAARGLFGTTNGRRGLLDERFGGELVRELNAYARADGVLTVSNKEAALLNDVLGAGGRAYAVPDFDDTEQSSLGFAERRGVLFVGNFRHPPNVDAVEHLCTDIVPLIAHETLEEHPISIVGTGADAKVHELAACHPGVRVVGWVPSVAPYLHAARISIVPLRYGAGTKRKLIQALLAGTPTVTTPAGIEGIDVADEEHVLLCEGPASFAAGIERLVADEALWARLSRDGRTRVAGAHGREAAEAALRAALADVTSRPAKALAVAWDGPSPDRSGDGVAAVRAAVDASLPPGARILVVSKGDPRLLDLPGRTASHFPQAEDGRYAGHHPEDGRAALQHLTELQEHADFLLVPASARWWLDYYADFARHLQACERVSSDDSCVIFRLRPSASGRAQLAAPAPSPRTRPTARAAAGRLRATP